YRSAASNSPRSFQAHFNLADAYRETKRYDDAIEEYRVALGIKPSDSKTHFFLGMAYRDRGNFADAARSFDRSLQIDGSQASAHEELGMIYHRKITNSEKAVYHYRKVLALRPNHPEADKIRGIINMLEGK
ncbi:MAG TPA: tetratricopeptide repeat protein, partial [Spirochaetota bacterium]|nr:tetratricopeptide repeat protein [Spirochaetota bacterium]